MNNHQVSKYFNWHELTCTNNNALREQNRIEAEIYYETMMCLSNQLLDYVRLDRPLRINSGFRGEALNSVTKGSARMSQHRLFQAADLFRPGENMRDAFDEILETLESMEIPFGQLIYEQVDRDYGTVAWVHISLGPDFRSADRCGEVLRRINDDWIRIKKVDCSRWELPMPMPLEP